MDSSQDVPSDLSVLGVGDGDVVADQQDRSVLALGARLDGPAEADASPRPPIVRPATPVPTA